MHCPWECKLIQSLWRTVWRFLKKLGIKLPYEPTIPLLVIYPEKAIIEKDTCTPVFIAALLAIASLVAQIVKHPPAMQETGVQSLGWEDPLKNGMAIHFHILWRIPYTEEPGGLQFMGSQRVGQE